MPENRVLKTLEKYRIKNEAVPIIVEGRNDVECLRTLEFGGQIITVNGGNPLLAFSEYIAQENDEIIILTDFDRKGVEIKNSLESYINSLGCRVDNELWNVIRRYMPIRTVEELPFAVKRIMDERGEGEPKKDTARRKPAKT